MITDDDSFTRARTTTLVTHAGHSLRVVGGAAVKDCDTPSGVVSVGLESCGFVDCGFAIVEQAFTPSLHVCSNLVSPTRPHFPSQDPGLAQQVTTPLLLRPHLGHPEKQGHFP